MGQQGRPRRSVFERISDYAESLTPDEVRDLVGRDAPRVYSVLLRDRTDRLEGTRGIKRALRVTRLLFSSVSDKLSPPRRLLFVLSLVFAGLGLSDLRLTIEGGVGFDANAGPMFLVLGYAGLLYLLAAELV